ncbi:MAG TPA: hydroxysqualene dehydroxylase HpnE [Xanthobacteraceae bacterium]|nr:hydroxysqualene dehydroxylase HpnE [Xanthobacteraceae bacterium]
MNRSGQIHIIGAGLGGLAAAVRLASADRRVVIHEAANQAGGRCRSYHDATLGMTIDNGNHLVLSGNHATLDYLATIGASERLVGPDAPDFAFVDLATGERWTLRLSEGLLPWWIFDPKRRVPGTKPIDYLSGARLLWAGADKTIQQTMRCDGAVYHRLWRPVLLAALNTDPAEASARLAGAVVRETLAAGGRACRPLIARDGLTGAFVEPALRFIEANGGAIRYGARLRALGFTGQRVESLDFGERIERLASDDAVVLAVPPWIAAPLVPDLATPTEFRAIVNAHFAVAPPAGLPPMIGVVNGTVEWVFAFPDRLSVTISGADRLLDAPREELAQTLWQEVAKVVGVAGAMPLWQLIKERRATFAALPGQDRKRPGAATRYTNMALAGDWTATGLPGTIEGAIRSGNRAADLIAQYGKRIPT